MFKLTDTDIYLLKQHDEQTYDKVRSYYINPLCLFLRLEFNLDIIEIESIADDAFIKAAYIKIDLFDPRKSDFRTWLYNIAKNEAIDYLRRNNYNSVRKEDFDIEQIPELEEEDAPDGILLKIKELLEEDEFNCLINSIMFDMKISEISKKYKISRATVFRKILSAKAKIRKYIEENQIKM